MNPPRRDLCQRPHHELPLHRSGVRQDQTGAIPLLPPIGDQVEVQRPRGIQGRAPAPERLLDPPQSGHQRVRIMGGTDHDDAVQEGRIIRVGPGLRPPPRGAGDHIDALGPEPGQGRLQSLAAVDPDPLVIAAQRDDDSRVQIRGSVDIDEARVRVCDRYFRGRD